MCRCVDYQVFDFSVRFLYFFLHLCQASLYFFFASSFLLVTCILYSAVAVALISGIPNMFSTVFTQPRVGELFCFSILHHCPCMLLLALKAQ